MKAIIILLLISVCYCQKLISKNSISKDCDKSIRFLMNNTYDIIIDIINKVEYKEIINKFLIEYQCILDVIKNCKSNDKII